jgi:hypothetical protein
MATSFLSFLDHTQCRTTFAGTPLDEWWARGRDLYLTTHDTKEKHPCLRLEPQVLAALLLSSGNSYTADVMVIIIIIIIIIIINRTSAIKQWHFYRQWRNYLTIKSCLEILVCEKKARHVNVRMASRQKRLKMKVFYSVHFVINRSHFLTLHRLAKVSSFLRRSGLRDIVNHHNLIHFYSKTSRKEQSTQFHTKPIISFRN